MDTVDDELLSVLSVTESSCSGQRSSAYWSPCSSAPQERRFTCRASRARTWTTRARSAVGVLSGSRGLAATIEANATGTVDPRPLIATTVGLDEAPEVPTCQP